jgi:hypothetical protein
LTAYLLNLQLIYPHHQIPLIPKLPLFNHHPPTPS